MEIKVRKIMALILCICFCVTSIGIEAKTKKTTGKDGENIIWNYNTETKTLTFSGNGAISDFEMDGHSAEPEWYVWSKKAEHIVVDEGITVIGEASFSDFSVVKSVKLPNTLKKIKRDAFNENQSLITINFPNNLEFIGAYAFSGCEKMELPAFPKKIKIIGEYAFCACNKIKTFSFPSKVEKIENGILSECKSLSAVYLSKNTKTIPEYAFSYSSQLKKVKIPESVRKVNMSAFIATSLKRIIIPKNVQVIKNGNHGNKVFGDGNDNKNLCTIEIRSKKIKSIQKKSFSGLSSKVVIKVPKSKKKKYTKMLRKSGLSKKVKIKSL